MSWSEITSGRGNEWHWVDGSWKQLEPLYGNPHRPPLTIGPPERRARSFPMPKRGNVKDEPDDGKAELEVRHRECHITSRLFAHTVHRQRSIKRSLPLPSRSCQTLSRERASFTSLTHAPLSLSLAGRRGGPSRGLGAAAIRLERLPRETQSPRWQTQRPAFVAQPHQLTSRRFGQDDQVQNPAVGG